MNDGLFAQGTHVSVTLTLNDGVKMPGVRWVGLPANAVFSDGGFTAEFDVTGDREISVVSLQALESRNLMVADSAVAWWDGIDNAGTGVHDPEATVWKDLVGFRDLPLTSRGSFGEKALVCGSGNTIAAGPAVQNCTDYRTFEVVFAPRIGAGCSILFTGGDNTHALTLSRNGIRSDYGGNRNYKGYVGLDASFSAVYEDDGIVTLRENGQAMPEVSSDNYGNLSTSLAVGGSGLYPYAGNVYAIRLHSRPLTEDEVRYNAAVDRVRFLGERTDAAFDGVTVPSTAPARWNATLGILEVLFTARGDAFGQVSVDGGAAAAVVETWVPVGCAATVAYVPTSDLGFKRWDDAPAGTTFSEDGLTAFVPVREKCGIAAVSNRPEVKITEVVSVGATEVTLAYDVGAMEVRLKAVVSSGAQVTTNAVGTVSGTGTCVVSGLATGTAYEVKLLAEANGITGESLPVSFTTNFRLMVRPDAAEGGDGRTWATAMAFSNALAAAEAATRPTEIWVAGENVLSAAEPARQFAVPVAIRGGFAGGEELATDRAEGAVSALDGAGAFNPLRFSNAMGADVVLERLEIRCAYDRAIDKSGAGDLTLTACIVVSNGMGNVATRDGKAICVHDATVALVTIVGTRFLDNRTTAPKNNGGKGACASFADCRRVDLRDCTFVGGGQALHAPNYNGQTSSGAAFVSSVPVVAERCRFIANFQGYWGSNGGIVRLDGGAAGSSFSHCLWAGNEDIVSWAENYDTNLRYAGSLVVSLSNAKGVVTVDSCTFAYNLTDAWRAPAGVNVACGDVRISSSVFGGNALSGHAIEKGVDIAVKAGASCTVAYSVLSAATNGFTSVYTVPNGTFAETGDNVYGDPLFVTEPADFAAQIVESSSYASFKVDPATEAFLRNLDAHVKSAAGYFTNDGTELTAEGVQSCAIDAGDPLADWSNEPKPNGKRRNAGCYGNTAEASKSATGEPAVASVLVDFVDGMPRPRVTFTVGGSGVFTASATVSISTNGTEWVQVGGQLTGLTRGDERSVTADLLLLPGTKAVAKVVLSAISSADEKSSDETDVTGELPIWYGRGGDPEKVVHVRAGAFGAGDGTSWGDAATDFNVALGLLTATRNELWIAGDIALADNLLGRTFGFSVTIRGGFGGGENDAAARRAGTQSTVDSAAKYTTFEIQNSAVATLTVERVAFERFNGAGFKKSGAGDALFRDCTFRSTGKGAGLSAAGSGGATRVVVTNCTFTGLGNQGSAKSGLTLSTLGRAEIVDCHFVTNGLPDGTGVYLNGGGSERGIALHADSAPVTVRNCRFASNHANGYTEGIVKGGGIVVLTGASGGSAFTNCAFVGNSDRCGWPGWGGDVGGTLVIGLNSADARVDVANCTFAYNVTDGISMPGGINLCKGAAKVVNSIFYGNETGVRTSMSSSPANLPIRRGRDIDVKAGSTLDVTWTLFGEEGTNSLTAAEGAVTNLAEGVVYGDPLFVSSKADFAPLWRRANNNGTIYTAIQSAVGTERALAELDVHLRGGGGYVDERTGRLVLASRTRTGATSSPAIDAGDPASDWSREPDVYAVGMNGGRVNLGAYGNTPWATMTRVKGSFLRVR